MMNRDVDAILQDSDAASDVTLDSNSDIGARFVLNKYDFCSFYLI